MLYAMHEAAYYASTPMRQAALLARDFWSSPVNPGSDSAVGRNLYASADLLANVTRRMSVMSRLKWISFTQGEDQASTARTRTSKPSMATLLMFHSGLP
jgi:poly-beta-hydroxyalkanoate depolymerase